MANYCNRCGLPLKDGQPCSCADGGIGGDNTIIETLKSRFNLAGAASPIELYEREMAIVPDCITADEGEVPLRQYDVAILRSRLKFERAEGRLQVTNKRVLFRAKGVSLPGKTLLQYEFEIGELAGIEARSGYKFSLLNLFIGGFLLAVGTSIPMLVLLLFQDIEMALTFFAYSFGIAGLVPFFVMKGRMWLKLISLGVSLAGLSAGVAGLMISSFMGDDNIFNLFGGLLLFVCIVLIVIALFLYMFVPNLVFTFKTKGGSPAVDVRAKKKQGLLAIIGIGNGNDQEFTGFDEVLPSKDTITAINEVAAMINDLKTLGDMAIEKWKKM